MIWEKAILNLRRLWFLIVKVHLSKFSKHEKDGVVHSKTWPNIVFDMAHIAELQYYLNWLFINEYLVNPSDITSNEEIQT